MTASALALSLALVLPAADVHVDELRGFRVDVPEGWQTSDQPHPEGDGHVFVMGPASAGGTEAFTLTILELKDSDGPEELLERTRGKLAERADEFEGFEELELEFGCAPCLGMRVDYVVDAGRFTIEQRYLVHEGSGFVLQVHAPAAEFEQRARAYDEVLESLAFVELGEQGRRARRMAELTARCGSEVAWAASWDEAAARAAEEDRLVLAVAYMYGGFALAGTPRTTTFMSRDVIELVNERFVPFWLDKGDANPLTRSYGMGPATFGQALMLADPEGDVLLETQAASSDEMAYAFLLEGLRRHPEFAGPPLEDGLAGAALAEALLARGELERAELALEGDDSGPACMLRARILRAGRDGPGALAELARARAAGGADDARLLLAEAKLLARDEKVEEASAALDALLAEHPGSDDVPEALLLRGVLDLREGGSAAARARWNLLMDEHPDSPFAWQAASFADSPLLDADYEPDLGWPDEAAVAEILAFSEPSPLPAERKGAAANGALAWLLANQRESGSWPSPTELRQSASAGPDPFVDAITAWAGRALLGRVREPGVGEALERALGFVLASVARREESPPLVLYMDYMTWSDACMLHFLADAVEAGLIGRKAAGPAAKFLIADLGARARSGGGWSYYMTPDLEGSAAPSQSISFTTATGVLALARAQAVGFDVPGEVLDPAIEALERMRGSNGVFAYFLYHDSGGAPPQTAAAGAVGRGPACELALVDAGVSDGERLRGALDLFLEHTPLYAAEQGKVMMHAGPDAQGCHYLFYDYAHAALAQARVPADARTRALVSELVLACRQPDGSFLDTPILGRSFGTAMALLALDNL